MKNEKHIVRTIAEIAQFVGLSPDRVRQLRTQGLPGKPGAYSLGAITRWMLAKSKGGGEWAAHLVESRARSARARAERDERLERIAAEKLIDPLEADEAELDRHGLIRTEQVRAALESMFERATHEIAHRSGEEIKAWIHARRLELCGIDPADGRGDSRTVGVHRDGQTAQASDEAGSVAGAK